MQFDLNYYPAALFLWDAIFPACSHCGAQSLQLNYSRDAKNSAMKGCLQNKKSFKLHQRVQTRPASLFNSYLSCVCIFAKQSNKNKQQE